MIRRQIQVKIENGLHARPAGELVKLLKPYTSDVHLIKEEKKINLKSIIQIMTTSIRENDLILIEADGTDEAEVVEKIEGFFQ